MTIKPKKLLKERQKLDDTIKNFLLTGNIPPLNTPGRKLYTSRFFDDGAIGKVWRVYQKELMGEWLSKNPCTRPWGWWEFDDTIEEPRKRLGGTGQSMDERYPSFLGYYERGIPVSWAEIDLKDPPLYESEAAYLERNKVLTPAEKTWLKGHLEALEPIKIDK